MNQITTQYVTENGACYEQYVITDPAAKTSLTITDSARAYSGRRCQTDFSAVPTSGWKQGDFLLP